VGEVNWADSESGAGWIPHLFIQRVFNVELIFKWLNFCKENEILKGAI